MLFYERVSVQLLHIIYYLLLLTIVFFYFFIDDKPYFVPLFNQMKTDNVLCNKMLHIFINRKVYVF